MATAKTLDLVHVNWDEYRAEEEPRFLEVGAARYLAITGKGEPGGPEFQAAVDALLKTALALRKAKGRGGHDFKVAPLEALWWMPKRSGGPWSFKALVRVPAQVSEREAKAAADEVAGRGAALAKKVQLETIEEGPCVQALHRGAYEAEAETIARMDAVARAAGRALAGPHHEIYLSDPRRSPPARLRTVLREPLAAPVRTARGRPGRDRLPSTIREVRSGTAPQHRARDLR